MAKSKLGRVTKRTNKRDFGKKNPLPKKLLFLSGIPFYAITECQLPDSKRSQTRIEIMPKSLQKLIKSYEDKIKSYEDKIKSEKKKCETQAKSQKKSKQANKTLKDENLELNHQLKEFKCKINELKKENNKIKYNNDKLLENIENNTPIEKSNIKTSSQLEKEKGMNHHGVPLQGGCPGNGKKK